MPSDRPAAAFDYMVTKRRRAKRERKREQRFERRLAARTNQTKRRKSLVARRRQHRRRQHPDLNFCNCAASKILLINAHATFAFKRQAIGAAESGGGRGDETQSHDANVRRLQTFRGAAALDESATWTCSAANELGEERELAAAAAVNLRFHSVGSIRSAPTILRRAFVEAFSSSRLDAYPLSAGGARIDCQAPEHFPSKSGETAALKQCQSAPHDTQFWLLPPRQLIFISHSAHLVLQTFFALFGPHPRRPLVSRSLPLLSLVCTRFDVNQCDDGQRRARARARATVAPRCGAT